jgi:hypothetical protein
MKRSEIRERRGDAAHPRHPRHALRLPRFNALQPPIQDSAPHPGYDRRHLTFILSGEAGAS